MTRPCRMLRAMGRRLSIALCGAGLALSLLAAPSTACAQDEEDDLETLRVVGTIGLALADVGFLAGDLYFGSEGEWVPSYVAWTQLLLMTPANIAMAILSLEHSSEGVWLGLAIGELVLGTWFAVHGTLSLIGQPDERPPPDPPATTATLTPLPDGGVVGALRTRF